jgi:ActR/RegA family two-component response regulator
MMPNQGRNPRILIVDDDDGDRRMIARSLKKERPCDCSEARDIDEALAACRDGAFDCALVDYRLPGLDGLAAITALHERCPHMPIIMLTGYADEAIASDARNRGACDYISKSSLNARSLWQSIESAPCQPLVVDAH